MSIYNEKTYNVITLASERWSFLETLNLASAKKKKTSSISENRNITVVVIFR